VIGFRRNTQLAPPPPPQPPAVELVYLDQGWNDDERNGFYNTSQGSQFMPFSWFLNLEQAKNNRPFRSNDNIQGYGYLPQEATAGLNEHGLPVGFVKDDRVADDIVKHMAVARLSAAAPNSESLHVEYQEWLGFTCAACHTSDITFANQTIRIDGGPPLSDFQRLIEDLAEALRATASDDAKLQRFATDVLAEGGYNPEEAQRLKSEINAFVSWLDGYTSINYAGLTTRYGAGRVDALGAILNRVTASVTGIVENGTPANAPVSYPMLWNVSQMSWVQWNGSANNHIGRNVGEVSGVFAHTIVNTQDNAQRFSSSANIVNLAQLEQWIAQLDSPKWGAPLPAIDSGKAELGKSLFATNCVACHGIRDAQGNFPMTVANLLGKQFIDVTMVPLQGIGTDPEGSPRNQA